MFSKIHEISAKFHLNSRFLKFQYISTKIPDFHQMSAKCPLSSINFYLPKMYLRSPPCRPKLEGGGKLRPTSADGRVGWWLASLQCLGRVRDRRFHWGAALRNATKFMRTLSFSKMSPTFADVLPKFPDIRFNSF